MASIRLTRRYRATPDQVWAALTEEGSLARWLAPSARLELEAGGAFELRFSTTAVEGTVREVEPGRVLELDWHDEGERPSVVRLELAPDGDGTRLLLHHLELEARVGSRHAAGWTGHLERLEKLL